MVTEISEATHVRAVRGATTVDCDEARMIGDAVRELLIALLLRNDIQQADIVSAVFTATPDIRSSFPATAARELGWSEVPMLCATEIDVPDTQPRCLRVLLHVERRPAHARLIPVYLREAASLRPDLAADRTALAEPLAQPLAQQERIGLCSA